MRQRSARQARLKGPVGIISVLVGSVFVTELAVMELFSPLFERLGTVAGALLDASLIVVLLAAPFWYFLFKLVPDPAPLPGGRTPAASLFFKALVGIFLVEYLVMLLLPQLAPGGDSHTRGLVDAVIAALATAIPLWFIATRPEIRRRERLLRESPLRLYVLLLCTVFLSDLLQELLGPLLLVGGDMGRGRVIDALTTTACGAPLLWLLVVRPLKQSARWEKTRVAAVHAQVIDAIVAVGPDGVISSFNPAAETIFDYRAAEMIGHSAAQLFDEGRRGLAALIAGACGAPCRREPSSYGEFSCRRRDGLALIMDVSISEVVLEERVEYLLIMRDVTSRNRMEEALRESEMRFREIFHQSEDAILFFRPGSCDILDANATACTIFGYRTEEMLAKGLGLMVPADELPALSSIIAGIGEGRGAQKDFRCSRRDGEQIVVSMRGKVMLLDGVPVTYCTFRDITERVRMQEKSRELQAKLIQTNKMTSLGLLVSGVAHEINNPNNFILANAELLARISRDTLTALREMHEERPDQGEFYIGGIPFAELGEHSTRLLQGITDGSRRVNAIVSNLKGFARQERSQAAREVDVNQVARSAISLLHHELIKYTDNFHFQPAEPLPPVEGHGQQLGQVIINLLMNACQALPDRSGGIWLSTEFRQAEGVVVIAVRDEGTGIPAALTERIMEPFFTSKLDQGGTGLGLSISRSIVKEHGGVLEFSSHPGGGTTFSVKLPATRPAGSA